MPDELDPTPRRRRGRRLRGLRIDRVDRVAEPDNPGAPVLLAKARGEPGDRPGTEPFRKRGSTMKLSKSRIRSEIDARAAEIRKQRPDLTVEQSVLAACDENPALASAHKQAPAEPEPEPEPEPAAGREPTLNTVASEALAAKVRQAEAERDVPYEKALDYVLKVDPAAQDLATLRSSAERSLPYGEAVEKMAARLGSGHSAVKVAKSL